MQQAQQFQQMHRENMIEFINMEFHTAPNPMLIPMLEPVTDKENQPQQISMTSNYMDELKLFPEQDPEIKFGIIQIKIADTPILQQCQIIDSSIDMSGSMDDFCSDGKTKMQHAKHTLKNIVTALAKNTDKNESIMMATYGFDDNIETIFNDSKITEDTSENLRNKIDKQLYSRGGTDIYQSLESQSIRCKARSESNPQLRQTNITLTDGQTNQGKSTLYSEMAKQVAPNCSNIFIGFGKDHNAIGLQQLADAQPSGSYFYVAEIEKAGLVFGEIIHQILYTALVDITIQMHNAEIYNYKTNEWKTELCIPSLVSEAKKTYHIRSKTPYDTSATIIASSAVHCETTPSVISADNSCPPPLLDTETYDIVPVDLSIYMLRQRTQELIYKAHRHSISDQILGEFKSYNERTKSIKKEMIQYLKFMRQYSKENSLEEDEQLNNLIADITIILKTFGGPRAALYSLARGTSQGRQTSNITSYVDPYDVVFRRKRTISSSSNVSNVSNVSNELRQKSFGLQRQYAVLNIQSNGDEQEPNPNPNSDDESDDEYHDLDLLGDLSDNIVPLRPTLSRTNTTPRQIQLMRECSQGTRQDDLNELDEQTTSKLVPDVFEANISNNRFPFPPIPPTNTTTNSNDIEEGLSQSI
jgi:hypothetical protein